MRVLARLMETVLILLDVLAGRLFEGLIAFFQELFVNTRDKFISTTTWIWTWDQITLIFWVRCKEVETFWSCRETIKEAVQEQLENSLHIVLGIGWIALFYLLRSALAPLFSSNFRFFMAFYAILLIYWFASAMRLSEFCFFYFLGQVWTSLFFISITYFVNIYLGFMVAYLSRFLHLTMGGLTVACVSVFIQFLVKKFRRASRRARILFWNIRVRASLSITKWHD